MRFLLWLFLPGILSGQSLQRVSFTHAQMGTEFRLVFYAADSVQAAVAAQAVFARVDSMNAAMSDYLPESELNRLCATAGTGQKVPVSEDLWRILRLSQRFARRSDGAFDVTVGPLTRLWRRARHLQALPDTSRINAALACTGYRYLHLYLLGRRAMLERKGMQLDLGGIAQGYAADVCLQMLRQRGYPKAMVDVGGDIALGDAPPGSAGWAISVPAQEAPLLLQRCGITSSGATYRYLEGPDGLRYSHIVDPRSGRALTHRVVVTVQARNATDADAWATALSVLGKAGLAKKPRRMKVWLTEEALNNG